MRVIALEEHFTVPELAARIDPDVIRRRGFRKRNIPPGAPNPLEMLPEIGERRLQSMDECGIDMQVLSNSGPGPDLVPGADGIAIARDMNDYLAEAVARYPERFAGFAVLPMCSPEAVSEELERAVTELDFCGALINGTTEGRFLDHPAYDDLLATAVKLDVPIFIHPHLAPEAVRQAYFSDLPVGTDRILETVAWGWHAEAGLHVLRLAFSGVLDKYPKLKLIIGHMGEMLPMMLARIDQVSKYDVDHLERPVSASVIEQVWITTSGVFTQPPFLAALQTFGIDRIMFSVDYPYAPNAGGRKFLDNVSLSPGDKHKLAHGTAERLLRLE